jgi:thiamine biosynthesis lipoprotein
MGCPCALHVAADRRQALPFIERAIGEIRRLDAKYSSYRTDSVISQLNRRAGKPCTVDAETASLFDYAHACFIASEGLFDITTGVYRDLWRHGMHRLPSRTELDACAARAGWGRIRRDDSTIVLARGMMLDLGGIVKEYAADSIAGLARRCGISGGIVDLGGDLRIIGPQSDGLPWPIGIADPDDRRPLATIELDHGAIATSGSGERYTVVDGRRYSHFIHPRTGWPVEGLRSATVVASTTVVAGSLATIACLKDRSGALSWLRAEDVPFLAIDHAGRLHRATTWLCARNDLQPRSPASSSGTIL